MLVVELSLKKSAKIVMLVFSQLSKKYAGLVERASIISFLLNSYWVCRSTRDCIEKTTSFNVTSVIERTCWCSGWKRYWPNSVQSNWNQSRSCKVLGNSSDSVRDAHNTLAHFSDFYTLFFLEVNHFYMKQNNLKLLVLKPHWTAFILVTSAGVNIFSPKISLAVILSTVCHTTPMMLVQRIWCWISWLTPKWYFPFILITRLLDIVLIL